MLPTVISISSLLISFAILGLGHGLQNTLLGIRATMENFPDWIIGLMMSGYFFGFIYGTKVCAKYINKVGQIRTFAAFAALLSCISLLHVLIVEPLAWVIFRTIHGLCIAGLYMVIESWLNAFANNHNRSRILSTYMIVNFTSLAAGQAFFLMGDPQKFHLFAISSILISLSLLPILLSKTRQPEYLDHKRMGIHELYKISPLALVGTLCTGLVAGAFWGLSAVYLTRVGLAPAQIAWFVSLSFLGGLFLQWPIGTISDKLNRRVAIAICSAMTAIVSLVFVYVTSNYNPQTVTLLILTMAPLFGGFSYPLYSLFISLANDFLKQEHFVRASGGLLVTHGIGAIIGPLTAGVLMEMTNYNGLFVFIAGIYTITLVFALTRMVKGRKIPVETTEPFVAVPRTTGAIFKMDPRYDSKKDKDLNC